MNRNSAFKCLTTAVLTVVLGAVPLWANAGRGTFLAAKSVAHASHHARYDSEQPKVDLPPAGNFAACASLFPNGVPIDIRQVDPKWKPYALCSGNYAVVYSGLAKTPLITIERLSRESLTNSTERTDKFYADPRLPAGERAELSDFVHSGCDRGHMAPAGDMPDPTAMERSFVLSNIICQDRNNNQNIWSKIESDTRKYIRRARGYVYVYTGPLFEGKTETVGRNRVWIPTAMFKLVYDETTRRSWAHFLPNTATAVIQVPTDYQSFVTRTNWHLLPN